MFAKSVDTLADLAAARAYVAKNHPAPFLVSSMMAGAYIGLGIILIFGLGQTVDPNYRPLVMGGCFGIALTLVVLAGCDLFTGLNMFGTMGLLKQKIGGADVARLWIYSWIGNLLGAALLAVIFKLGGGGIILKDGSDLIFKVAAAKMSASPVELVARAMLCNWLVCLALWCASRTTSDAAKCIVIFWCLFAFIASGFEHSVANMTVFTIALLGNHPPTVTLHGMLYNLVWVSLGNILSGSLFMGVGYWFADTEGRARAGSSRIGSPSPAPAE
jgi:nitrite transporter NirC